MKESYNKYCGESIRRLRRLRKERGISQKDMAKDLGIGKSTLSDYETGKIKIYAAVFNRILDYFSLDEIAILKEDKELLDITSFTPEGKQKIQLIYEEELKKAHVNSQLLKRKK